MREIKYREYLGNGRWHYWGFGIENGYGFTSPMQTYDGKKTESQRYTGLKDKNGTEIYEGDILKWGIHVAEVKYQEGYLTFDGLGVSPCNKQSEVIGNIYENPELLS